MGVPTIYSNKKHALPGEEITVIASIGVGEWEFPNALSGDIEIVSGSMTDNVLVFKCLATYDPLIVSFLVIDDVIRNGSVWNDSISGDVLGDYWTTPSTGQYNTVLSGYNFNGRSQRITQTLSGMPSISQSDLTVSGGSYSVELDYRATTDIELKVGGHIYDLPRTNEGDPFPIYPIVHEAGLVNFEATDGGNIKWLLADGSVEYDTVVSKNLVAGTSYLIMDDFVGQSVGSVESGINYIGSLSDIPSGLSVLQLEDTGVVGDIIELDHVQDVIYISNTPNIHGDIVSFSGVGSTIDLSGCENIKGDISVLENTTNIILDGTAVSGTVTANSICTYWSLNDTNLDKLELETSLVNLANWAEGNDIYDGYFKCYHNMPTITSSSACASLSKLADLFWNVMVHSDCDSSEF